MVIFLRRRIVNKKRESIEEEELQGRGASVKKTSTKPLNSSQNADVVHRFEFDSIRGLISMMFLWFKNCFCIGSQVHIQV